MARPLTRVQSIAALVLLGVGWGSTQPLGKIAASSGHPPLTLILWQTVICVVVLGALTLVRGKGLVLTRRALGFYLAVAVLGAAGIRIACLSRAACFVWWRTASRSPL